MTIIEFKNVSKHFRIYKNRSYSIKERFINKALRRNKLEIEEFSVLKDASFKIQRGETIGIIGENGTGKSTTLKLISQILYPDAGEIIVDGKVSALLEVGAGFQPDLTGKENVYLYGSILGLSKEEISSKYQKIVDFAELESFMEMPVKNYSSGMYMRLAFAVAINVDPDILIVDEVLAVGDENFQKKCIDKILSFKEEGKTIVFVSHDMSIVRKICHRVIFIKKGGYIVQGTPEQMIGLYLRLLHSSSEDKQEIERLIEERAYDDLAERNELEEDELAIHTTDLYKLGHRLGSQELEFLNIYFSDANGIIKNTFDPEESIKLNVQFKKNKEVESCVFGFSIYTEEGYLLTSANSKQQGIIITDIRDKNIITVTIHQNPFLEGIYYLTPGLYHEDCEEQYDVRERHYYFRVKENNIEEEGKIRVNCSFTL